MNYNGPEYNQTITKMYEFFTTKYFIILTIVFIILSLSAIWIILGLAYNLTSLELLAIELSIILLGIIIGGFGGWVCIKYLYPLLYITLAEKYINRDDAVFTALAGMEFDLTYNDAMAYYIHKHKSSTKSIRERKILQIAFFLDIFIMITILILLNDQGFLLSIALGFLALLILFYYFSIPWLTRLSLKRHMPSEDRQRINDIVGNNKLSFNPKGIQEYKGTAKFNIPWGNIDTFSFTEQHLFILPHNSKPYIIPRRAFIDLLSFRQFVKTVKAYYEFVKKPKSLK